MTNLYHIENYCPNCHRKDKAHCPTCGSYRHYALVRQKDNTTRPDGQQVELRVYRCIACGLRYNEDDWKLRCGAEPDVAAMFEHERLMNMQREELAPKFKSLDEAPENMRNALEIIKKMRGIK